jgi:hypothetical protein
MAVNPYRRGGGDVIIGDGGTSASNAATALANLGGLSTTTHGTINHQGLAGIPPLYSQVLDSTSTLSDINTALADSNTHIVYLKPGNYNHPFAQITVPAGKQLIGLTSVMGDVGGTLDYTRMPVLRPNTQLSAPFITVQPHGKVKDIYVTGESGGPGSASAYAITQGSFTDPIWLENVHVRNWGFIGTVAADSFVVGRGRFVHCQSQLGKGVGFRALNTGSFQQATIFEGCQAYTSSGHGFRISDGPNHIFFNCQAEANGGDGFYIDYNSASLIRFTHCWAESNNNGWNWPGSSASWGCGIYECTATGNTLWGFITTTAAGSLRAQFHDNMGGLNGSGNFSIGSGWSLPATNSNAT